MRLWSETAATVTKGANGETMAIRNMTVAQVEKGYKVSKLTL